MYFSPAPYNSPASYPSPEYQHQQPDSPYYYHQQQQQSAYPYYANPPYHYGHQVTRQWLLHLNALRLEALSIFSTNESSPSWLL